MVLCSRKTSDENTMAKYAGTCSLKDGKAAGDGKGMQSLSIGHFMSQVPRCRGALHQAMIL